jgi:phosphatidate cytidylyltransferase
MLFQRILTALVLAAVAISAIFLLPILYFYLFIGIIVLIAGWEWTELSGIHTGIGKILFTLFLIVPMLGITFWTQILETLSVIFEYPEIKKYSGLLEWLVIGPTLFWVFMMVLIRNQSEELLRIDIKKRYKLFLGLFVLFSAWMFLTRLRAFYGPEAVMYFLALIWVADISAYFTGMKWGKNKLAPAISPGKTIEGMYGALFSALVMGLILVLTYGYPFLIAADFILLSVLTVLVSIYGDLFFSLVKRRNGVKDSGTLLPGHGGVLDRIDSVIAATPFYYAGVILIGRSVFA